MADAHKFGVSQNGSTTHSCSMLQLLRPGLLMIGSDMVDPCGDDQNQPQTQKWCATMLLWFTEFERAEWNYFLFTANLCSVSAMQMGGYVST